MQENANINQEFRLGQSVKFWDRIKVLKQDPKRFRLLVIFISISLLVFLGILVSILERIDRPEPKPLKQAFDKVELEVQPGEMVWLLFEDLDKDGVFDHQEQVVKDVSVAIKRPGDEEVWRSQPADVNGIVKMTDLPVGEYYFKFLNYKEPEKGAKYYFYNTYVYNGEFLPTDWKYVSLGETGYKDKIGLVKHQPDKLVVVKDSLGLRLVDLKTQTDFAWFRNLDGLDFQNGKIVYLGNNQLIEFDLTLRTEKVLVDRLYNMEGKEFELSQDFKLLVFEEDEEFRYRSENCGDGYIIVDGQRLHMDDKKFDLWQDEKVLLQGKIGKDGDWRVYELSCGEKKLEAEKLFDGQTASLGYIDEQTIFYSNNQGSYFYELDSKEKVLYTALGANKDLKINKERFLVYAKDGGELIVVDYPAVKASGVEKHYVIPMPKGSGPRFVSQNQFIYLDGNSVVQVSLKGSGVWEVVGKVELKGFQAQGLLGEITL